MEDDEGNGWIALIANWLVNILLVAFGAFLVFRILIEAIAAALGIR